MPNFDDRYMPSESQGGEGPYLTDEQRLERARDAARARGWKSGRLSRDDFAALWNAPHGALVEVALRLQKAWDDAHPDIGMGPTLGMLAEDLARRISRL